MQWELQLSLSPIWPAQALELLILFQKATSKWWTPKSSATQTIKLIQSGGDMNLSIFGLPGLVSWLSSTIRAGPAFRFAAARTELSALPSRPLQAYMDLDRVRRHIRP